MKVPRLTRRRFLGALFLGAPAVALGDAVWLEPEWINIRKVQFNPTSTHRLVHFTDLHHKGDRAYLKSVVSKINALSPDLVCFTGDLIEDEEHVPEALELLAGIKAPMFGVPGNHDYWSNAAFEPISRCFEATGGAWLLDQAAVTRDGEVNVIGLTCTAADKPVSPARHGLKNVMLIHYPAWVKKFGATKYDLVLAGHSHGGQVRIPFYGPVVTAFGVDEYDLGLYQTSSGPLYVNPGIGWFYQPIRFRCRPEITLILV